MSIQNEIKRISTNISAAYDAVEEMGGAIPEERNSANLADAIHGIASAGDGGVVTPYDPIEVYKTTRPADWLKMPDPQADEIYLLLHLPDGVSSLLAFTATCTGDYTVETGTAANGVFIPSASASVASGVKYETELSAYDFGDLTGSGLKQCMVKISGRDILTWEPATHSKKTSPTNFASWNIVEVVCRLPKGSNVTCGNVTPNKALKKLRYFSWYGANQVTDMSYMFANCYSLTAIPALDTSGAVNMANMFDTCYALTAFPQLDTAKVTDMNRMFYNCGSLTTIPWMDTAGVTNMNGMFYYCYSLSSIPQMDTAKVTNMGSMFYYCSSLTAVPQLNTASATSMSSMFSNCYSLAKFTTEPSVTGWAGYALNLQNCSFTYKALIDFFNSLPVITAAKHLTLTGNPGLKDLTDADRAIVTSKNWTL